jgi:hypothetical protein
MLKLIFFLLLLANGVLFAFHQGYLGSFGPGGHEPERMKNQLNADKIKLIAAPASAPAPAPDAGVPAVQRGNPNEQAAPKMACLEIGAFTAVEARRFEAQLASLPLADKPTRLDISEPSSHMVFIPPQNGKSGADKKVAELRALGVTDYFVLQDNPNPELRWGVSLGIFKSEEAARAFLAQLGQKGVRSARLAEYKAPMRKIAFRLQADSQTRSGIEKLKSEFPNQQVRECPEASGD